MNDVILIVKCLFCSIDVLLIICLRRNFQSFSADQTKEQYGSETMYSSNPYLNPGTNVYQGSVFTPAPMDATGQQYASSGPEAFEDELPLLEGTN